MENKFLLLVLENQFVILQTLRKMNLPKVNVDDVGYLKCQEEKTIDFMDELRSML